MEKHEAWKEILEGLIGGTVIGINHDYKDATLTVVFKDEQLLRFSGCISAYDFGIIGTQIAFAEIGYGEFSQQISLRQRGVDLDQMDFCTLSADPLGEALGGNICIAFTGLLLDSPIF
jgi:hypothetical protein